MGPAGARRVARVRAVPRARPGVPRRRGGRDPGAGRRQGAGAGEGPGRGERSRARGRGARRRARRRNSSANPTCARSSSFPAGWSTSSPPEPTVPRRLDASERARFTHVPVRDLDRAHLVRVPVLTPGIAGMTLGRWILLRQGHEHDRGLIAHELVHVRQWRELGAARFLSATSARTSGAGGAGSATGPPTRRSRSRPKRGSSRGADNPFRAAAGTLPVIAGSAASGFDFPSRFLRSLLRRARRSPCPTRPAPTTSARHARSRVLATAPASRGSNPGSRPGRAIGAVRSSGSCDRVRGAGAATRASGRRAPRRRNRGRVHLVPARRLWLRRLVDDAPCPDHQRADVGRSGGATARSSTANGSSLAGRRRVNV